MGPKCFISNFKLNFSLSFVIYVVKSTTNIKVVEPKKKQREFFCTMREGRDKESTQYMSVVDYVSTKDFSLIYNREI